MKKGLTKNQILIKFLFSYIIILMIPLLMGVISYYETIRIVEKDAREANLSVLEQSMSIIDKNMAQINDLTIQMAFSTNVQRFYTMDSPLVDGTVVSDVRNLQEYMLPYKVLNKFIKMFYIYFKQSDIIVSPNTSYIRMEDFYNYFFSMEGVSYNQFREVLEKPHKNEVLPAAPVTIDKSTAPMITYMQSLPIDGIGEIEGNMMVFISEKEITDLLKQINIDGGGWWYICDPKGRIITSSPTADKALKPVQIDYSAGNGYRDLTILGKRMLITYAVSPNNGWGYVAAIPMKAVLEKAANIKKIIWLIMLVSLIIGVLLSYWLAYHNSKPINDLISMLRDKVNSNSLKGKDTYDFLKSSFKELVNSNQTMQEELRRQVPLLRNTFFNQFLSGDFINAKDAQDILDKAGIHITGTKFAVLILSVNDYNNSLIGNSLEELNMIKIIIKDMLTNNFQSDCCWSDIDLDKIVLLLQFNGDDRKSIINKTEERVKALKSTILQSYHINVSFSGSFSEDLIGISRAFYEARQALEYRSPSRNLNVVWYRGAIAGETAGFYYPIDIELKIINMMKAENVKGLERLIMDVYRENFIKRKLHPEMVRQLIGSMQGTIIRTLDQINGNKDILLKKISEIRNELDKNTDYMSIFTSLISVFTDTSEAINLEKKNYSHELKNEILEYINSNYVNPNICLSSVATHFNITEVYLSRFFKEQAGENFSKYIEKIRMEKACELLSAERYTIADVSKMVGYNSPHAFRRAFKRIYGKNPTDCFQDA